MYVTVDETDARPLYQQLVDEIKTLIAKGELAQGTSLPPVRQVASDLGVNLNTVAFAYRRLQKEGLIRIRHGSGAVVISQTVQQKPEDGLRNQLRTALTQLVLAGLKPSEIKGLISEELDELLKESKKLGCIMGTSDASRFKVSRVICRLLPKRLCATLGSPW